MADPNKPPEPWSIYPKSPYGSFGVAQPTSGSSSDKFGLGLAMNAFHRRKKEKEDELSLGASAIQSFIKRNPLLAAQQSMREAGARQQKEQADAKELRRKRVGLRDKLYDAQSIEDDKERAGAISSLKSMGVDDLGVDADIFDTVAGQQKNKYKEQQDKEAYWDAKIDSSSLGDRRRKLHTRRSGLRKAKALRRMGFTRAAERAAANWADSPEGDAPAISTPSYRAEQGDQSARVAEARQTNQRLQKLLMKRMEQRLQADPNYMPNTEFKL